MFTLVRDRARLYVRRWAIAYANHTRITSGHRQVCKQGLRHPLKREVAGDCKGTHRERCGQQEEDHHSASRVHRNACDKIIAHRRTYTTWLQQVAIGHHGVSLKNKGTDAAVEYKQQLAQV